jgi:dTDP-glucose 4,6-dehydratase
VRDWLYVDDHVSALLAVLERGRPGETYAIGGRSERRNIDVVQTVCRHLDAIAPRNGGGSYADLMTFVTDRPGHDLRYAFDDSQVSAQTGWAPVETFDTGIVKAVHWYRDNEAWWRPLMERAAALAAD